MTPTLFIRVPETPEAQVQWLHTDSQAADVPVSVGDLADVSVPDTSLEIIVFVPAAVVGLTEIDIPAQNRAQLLKAVPFALEDEMAENVDGLHFAVRPRRNRPTLVGIVQRDWMAALLARLAQHGLSATAVVPETLCLPWQEGEWTLLVEDHGAVLRTGRQAGFALDTENLKPVLESVTVAEEEASPELVRVYDRRQDDLAPLPLPAGDTVMTEPGQVPVLTLLARSYFEQRPVNLLQGEFAAQPGWHRGWLQWRVAAGLLAAVVAVHLIGISVENRFLERQREALNAAMAEVYRRAFPDAVRIINPATQMRSRLTELRQQSGGSGAGFMDLVALAGPRVIGDARVAVKLLRYRDGRMELDLDADTIERLEALQRRLRDANLSAELKSVRNEGGRSLGRVVVGAQSS
jgi:general secretion pathway protein L